MAIKFEKITAGMRLYDVRINKGLSGNKWNTWPVNIISVDTVKSTVVASWNGNKPEEMSKSRVTKFRAKRPKSQ